MIAEPGFRRLSTRNDEDWTMRFMVLVKADKTSESGALPDGKMLTAMG